ncbi:MAG: hypothetical protein EBR82_82685 [Caulobacteraceae bacterium]|jgi:hypothetical protein|nr:hypothetical protein [Caulobacteraceae bacterium]
MAAKKNYYSAFSNLPSGSGATIGSAGQAAVLANTVQVKDLYETLRKFDRASYEFSKELRKVAYTIAKDLSTQVRIEAGTVSRATQAIQVAKGLRASNDRFPLIKLRGNESFVSKSRPNSKRKKKVTRADVFFGAEFGGGLTPKTKQFLRHRGQSGYFFWPTVRKRKNEIAKEYLEGIDKVVKNLGIG